MKRPYPDARFQKAPVAPWTHEIVQRPLAQVCFWLSTGRGSILFCFSNCFVETAVVNVMSNCSPGYTVGFCFVSVANRILFPKIYICFKTKTLSKWALKASWYHLAAHAQHLCINEAPKGLVFSPDFSVLPCQRLLCQPAHLPSHFHYVFLKFLVHHHHHPAPIKHFYLLPCFPHSWESSQTLSSFPTSRHKIWKTMSSQHLSELSVLLIALVSALIQTLGSTLGKSAWYRNEYPSDLESEKLVLDTHQLLINSLTLEK